MGFLGDLVNQIKYGTSKKKNDEWQRAHDANAATLAANAARFQREGRFSPTAQPGVAARNLANASPARRAANFPQAPHPSKSFLRQFAEDVAHPISQPFASVGKFAYDNTLKPIKEGLTVLADQTVGDVQARNADRRLYAQQQELLSQYNRTSDPRQKRILEGQINVLEAGREPYQQVVKYNQSPEAERELLGAGFNTGLAAGSIVPTGQALRAAPKVIKGIAGAARIAPAQTAGKVAVNVAGGSILGGGTGAGLGAASAAISGQDIKQGASQGFKTGLVYGAPFGLLSPVGRPGQLRPVDRAALDAATTVKTTLADQSGSHKIPGGKPDQAEVGKFEQAFGSPMPKEKPAPGVVGKGTYQENLQKELFGTRASQDARTQTGDTALAPQDVNTAKNPFKAPIPKVKQGDYKQIISNEQTASNPILVAGDRWKLAMKNLQKKSPDEYKDFWRYVEKPDSIKSPHTEEAVKAWREVDNRIHGTSQRLGGNTNYLTDHGLHPWNLPEDMANHLSSGGNIENFPGISSFGRKYRTIQEGEANGLELGTDPLGEGSRYVGASAASLRKRAIIKGLTEADGHISEKTHYLDLGGSETIPISEQAHKQLRGLQKAHYSNNKAKRGIRTANTALRTTILSGGQFHPINISLLRAGPSLIATGHPVRAVKGMVGTFTATKGRVEKMYNDALSDKIVDPGTGKEISVVDAAAKIGAPYAQRGYETSGTALKGGVGHKLVFERQIPMMHDQVVRSVLADLQKKGVPLDSAEARQAGIAANSTMGFINKEALNLSTTVRKGMSDWMLASQFTPSKIVTLSKVAKGGVAGKYARADVLSNVAAATAIITGVGYLLGQKSDNLTDSLLRALISPSVPTQEKDANGNNIEMRIPATYTSELAKILGISLKRKADGHLGVSWKPDKSFSSNSGLMEWARSRLAPVQSDVLKVATNTNFAEKPLYDPEAPLKTKTAQALTTLGVGALPIGAQGIPYTDTVKNAMPKDIKDVLDANTPGTDPLLKSLASSTGFSPRTDSSVGKGLSTRRYFESIDEAKKGLNEQAKRAIDEYAGAGKKNPVTGKYEVEPSVWDTIAHAALLNQNPEAIDALIDQNKKLAELGEKVDPLWLLPPERVKDYFQMQADPDPLSAQRRDWKNRNNSWYKTLQEERGAFFDSLPKGDPNKPQAPIEYPEATPQVFSLIDRYGSITDSKQKFQFLKDHPEVQDQFDKQFKYTNDLLTARGYTPYKDYPKAAPEVQSFIDNYLKDDNKARRSALRNARPDLFNKMGQYFDATNLFTIDKQASVSQLQGEPDYTSQEAKAIQGLSQNIYQTADGSYAINSPTLIRGVSGAVGGSIVAGAGNPSNTFKSYGSGGRKRSKKTKVRKVRIKVAKVRTSKGSSMTKPQAFKSGTKVRVKAPKVSKSGVIR